MGLPVLLWGPRDERPDENGVRLRDSQCGLFATGKVLRRFVWHDRIHAKAMWKMMKKTFPEVQFDDVFCLVRKLHYAKKRSLYITLT